MTAENPYYQPPESSRPDERDGSSPANKPRGRKPETAKPSANPAEKALAKPAGPKPWFIAAWPGMGHVGVIAAGALVNQLRMKPVGEFSSEGFFDLQHVIVKDGVVQKPHLPRTVLYSTPKGARTPLFVLLSEAQPTNNAFAFANRLLDKAAELGAERIVTFASNATQMHPSQDASVTGAATDDVSGADLRRLEVNTLSDGAVAGMSGVLLGAAAERGMHGLCLLGEIPAFAAGVPNPKAAEAVLRTFGIMHNVPIDTQELSEHGKTVEAALLDMLSKKGRQPEFPDDEGESDSESDSVFENADGSVTPQDDQPDRESLAQVERLFEQASKDRTRTGELKAYLDAHGLFARFENRFLDLFRRAK